MSFFIQYRNHYRRQKYYTLGRVGKLTADEARALARTKFADITHEKDPADQRREDKSTMTVAELCDWYFAEGTGLKKPKTLSHNKGSIEHHIKPLIGSLLIKEVDRATVERLVRDIENGDKIRKSAKQKGKRGHISVRGGITAATRTLQLLGTIFEFAIKHEKLNRNPARGIKRPADNINEVFLTEDEIKSFGRLLSNPSVISAHRAAINAIKLILLTGCRKGEILSLQWSFIDWENQRFKFPDTKTGKQSRPFGKGALALLQELRRARDSKSPFVFPATKESEDGYLVGIYKMFNRILRTKDNGGNLIFHKEGLTLHSLRHTFASLAAKLNYTNFYIKGLLGHSTDRNDITAHYIHHDNDSLTRAADRVSERVQGLLAVQG